MDGDGLVDLVEPSSQGVYVQTSTGSQFQSGAYWSPVSTLTQSNSALADVTGDGRADIIEFTASGTYVLVADTSPVQNGGQPIFDTATVWGSESTGSFLIADVNGDGMADLISWGNSTGDPVSIALSTGNGFGALTGWNSPALPDTVITMMAGDVDGDGCADLVLYGRYNEDASYAGYNVSVSLSECSPAGGFGAWHMWLTSDIDLTDTGLSYSSLADVNGDGLMDMVVGTTTSTGATVAYVCLSTQSAFASPAIWETTAPGSYLGDVNGDGYADEIYPTGIQVMLAEPGRDDWGAYPYGFYYFWNETQGVVTEFAEAEQTNGQNPPTPNIPIGTAEWIMERPGNFPLYTSLADYGTGTMVSAFAMDFAGNYYGPTSLNGGTAVTITTVNSYDAGDGAVGGTGNTLQTVSVTGSSLTFTWDKFL